MMEFQSCFQVSATLVANEFIDSYMAAANGEYVKVYLFLLRHRETPVEPGMIADALNHTESDVRRALTYWEKLGILKMKAGSDAAGESTAAARQPEPEDMPRTVVVEKGAKRQLYSPQKVAELSSGQEFSQLLYIAQKYLNRIFTQRESEVFAYMYDELHMSIELLEYLVEYCVQSGHSSIRYIETVALNWYEEKIDTTEKAKAYTSGFNKNSFAVMKAFGLSERRPGEAEKEMIEKWFSVYGFSRELVTEACGRTLSAIHKPSFQYADKILSEWNKAGVKNPGDLEQLAQKRSKKDRLSARRKAESSGNRFHNFEQRDTDYNSLVLEQVKSWLDES